MIYNQLFAVSKYRSRSFQGKQTQKRHLMIDSTQRFTRTVANYIRYRPDYPQALLDKIIERTGVNIASSIADIGAGTGIFSKLLLDNSLSVTAIEPNRYMLGAAKETLSSNPDFRYLNNSAEQTGLTARSVDLICVAQAFHWFNQDKTLVEFKRVLKPFGYIALIWNQREEQHPFQNQYDSLLIKYATDYQNTHHMNMPQAQIARFFAPGEMHTFDFTNAQQFDLNGLIGRIKSCSYCPHEDSTDFSELSQALERLFNEYSQDGLINFDYNCKLYIGRLHVPS